jgi:hypothetical protein
MSNIWWLLIVTCISSMTALSSHALLRWLGIVISHRVECIVVTAYSHMNSFFITVFSDVMVVFAVIHTYIYIILYIHTYNIIHTYIHIILYIHTCIHTYLVLYIIYGLYNVMISRILKPTLYFYILYPPFPWQWLWDNNFRANIIAPKEIWLSSHIRSYGCSHIWLVSL